MQPNHKVTGANLGVDGFAFGVAVNAARGETKRFNKKIMPGCDVLVHEDWNDLLALGHICLRVFHESERVLTETLVARSTRWVGLFG